jgi:hypothetical protein
LTSPEVPDIGLIAYREAMSMDAAGVVRALSDLLGVRLVAYIGSVKEARAVRQWSARERTPAQPVIKRLRDTYQIARLLSETHSPEVVQAWFQGMNPLLGDLAPARLLRDSESDETAHRVLAAARDFVAATQTFPGTPELSGTASTSFTTDPSTARRLHA